jgi:hypothetical protein
MSQPSLAELLKPRQYRKASVQLLWPKSVKLLVQELAGELGTSVNELVLRSLQRSIPELATDEQTSADIRKLVQSLVELLEQAPVPSKGHSSMGSNPTSSTSKEDKAA